MAIKTQQILRNIQRYATATIILTAIITTIIAILPLYLKLENVEQRNVIYSRDSAVFIIDQYLLRLKDIAKQISSRTKAAELTQEYNNKKISAKQLSQGLTKILHNALRNNTHLVGITRINLKGQVLSSVGKPISHNILVNAKNIKSQTISKPTVKENHYFIPIITPIYYDQTHNRIGIDITLFDITNLHAKISHHKDTELGDTLIGYLKDDKPQIFFKKLSKWQNSIEPNKALYHILHNAIKSQQTNLISTKINNESVIIAHAPTYQSPWSVAVIVKKTELTAAIKRTLWSIFAVIIIVIILFIAGLELILKPISNKILIAHDELEFRIKENQAALQQANEKLQHMADHDFLTNLLNRRGFNHALEKEMSRARRNKLTFTIIYLDINGFKKINDKLGHQAGDEVLKTIANRLSEITRKEDAMCRIGGDEFAIIATNTSDDINTLKNKISQITEKPIFYKKQQINCRVSVGISTYPKHGKNIETLINHADKEMYADKKRYT